MPLAACARIDASSTQSDAGLVAPSPIAATTLTVQVRERGSNAPIAGAAVRSGAVAQYTDSAGETILGVARGCETIVNVSAAGFHSMEAAATLNGNERWTFYLETQR